MSERPVSLQFPHLPAEAWKLYLEDRLGDASAAAIERHLDGCPDCRDRLEEADGSRLFRRLRSLQVRDEVFEGFWEAVREELPVTPGRLPDAAAESAPPRGAWGRRLAFLGGVASVVLAFALQPSAPLDKGAAPASCPPAVAHLQLTKAECRALFEVSFDEPPVVIYQPGLDLEKL